MMRQTSSTHLLLTEIFMLILLVGVSGGEVRADTFELINGDKLTGTVASRTPDEVMLDHPILGRLVIPVQTLKLAENNPGLLGTSILKGWDKELDLSLLGTRGNSDDGNLSIGLDLPYADNKRRWSIRGQYHLSHSDGDVDTNDSHLASDRDWLFAGSRWFVFTSGRYDYDQFESWKHRFYWGGGPGYHLL
jgi:hypothetical protein